MYAAKDIFLAISLSSVYRFVSWQNTAHITKIDEKYLEKPQHAEEECFVLNLSL